jgi:hypothetical protein
MNRTGKLFAVAAVILILMLASISVGYAITHGQPDGDGHPYVGMVTFYVGGEYEHRCSGTLLSPTVLLTAGHCTAGMEEALVRFDPDLEGETYPLEWGYPGTPYWPDEAWTSFPNTYDVGVVVLDEPIPMDEYGTLPELGLLDSLARKKGQKDRIIRTVGYGLQEVKPFAQADRIRYTSTSMIVNMGSALEGGYGLRTSNNAGQGQGTGGACFGDSGGPIFYPEDSNQVVGIVSWGVNANCKGVDWAYRADIEETQEFVAQFLDN